MQSVSVRFAGAEGARQTTKGCVQGSAGGPTFWTLLINPLLEEVANTGTYYQAFADDIVLVFSGPKAQDISYRANAVLAHVHEWGVENKLRFDNPLLNKGLYRQLCRAAKLAVIEPIILHAASVCAPAAKKLLVRRQLDAVQRDFAQTIARTYRTAFLNSAVILAGLLPLDLRVREAAHLFEIKRSYSRQVVGNRDLELPVSYLRLPHPSGQFGVEFSCLEVGEEAVQLATAAADLVIYTDGSRIEDKVGAAFCVM
ncbi:uncharacterized protein [Battus philenor]|uniref:uncharacterized protein n=1 Tax=Battus philenor TaxID=42288 RepID=UPI0035D01D09